MTEIYPVVGSGALTYRNQNAAEFCLSHIWLRPIHLQGCLRSEDEQCSRNCDLFINFLSNISMLCDFI